MDLLSDVIRDLRLESVVLSTSELRAPWGFDKGTVRGAAPFHVIVAGGCRLDIPQRPTIELAIGDLVVFPHGDRHSLSSDADASRVPFSTILEASGLSSWTPGQRLERLDEIRYGGHGTLTRMINGLFVFRDRRSNPLVESLPAVLHVQGRMGRGPDWLRSLLSLLIDETMSGRPGFQTLTERLADIVFVQAVRDHVSAAASDTAGWLRGLTDPPVARALSLIHARPGEPWTVASLASSVALSRTAFARRFRERLGSSVMAYVAARRMHAAAGLLVESTHAMNAIASDVGYESEISFNKAFKRWAGVPPGQYRRQSKRYAASPERALRVADQAPPT